MGLVCIMLRKFGTFLKHVEFLRDPRSNAQSNLASFSVECTVESCEVLSRMHGPERETDKSAAGGRQAYTISCCFVGCGFLNTLKKLLFCTLWSPYKDHIRTI